MTLKEIAPWRWGGFRSWDDENRPTESYLPTISGLRAEMDRLIDDFFAGRGRSIGGRGLGDLDMVSPWSAANVMPRIDQTEDEKAFHVNIELPGMDEDDVDLTLSNGTLIIRGEKKREADESGRDFYHRERVFGAFHRTLPIPSEVDENAIEASFKKGVLSIDLPKSEEARQQIRHIDVKAA